MTIVASKWIGGVVLVEIILTAVQLTCLKDAVPAAADERLTLDRGEFFTGSVNTPELISVKCTLEIARALLDIARKSCPDLVPEIRAAIEQAT
jgi:hypothetical protein